MLGRKALLQFITENTANFLGFIATFFVARFMGPVSLGTVGFSLSLFTILSIFSDLGFSQAHIKRVSEGEDLEAKVGTFAFIRIVMAAIFILVVLIYTVATRAFGLEGFTTDIEKKVFLFFFISFLLNIFSGIALTTFQGLRQTAKFSAVTLLGRVSKLISTPIVALLSLGMVWLAFTFTIESLILFISSLFLLQQFCKIKLNTKYLGSYTKFALPLAGIAVLSNLIGNADKLLIKNFWGLKDVGIYFAIQSLMAFPQSLSNSLMTLFFPKVSELFKNKDLKSIQKHFDESIKYLLTFIFPIVILSISYSKEIPAILFGKEIGSAQPVMIVSSITALIITIARPFSNILYAAERGKHLLILGIINFIVLITSDLVFIPELGPTGAAIGIMNMWAVSLFIMFLLSRNYIVTSFLPTLIKTTTISIITFLCLFILRKSENFPPGIYGIILGTTACLSFYTITLILFRVLNRTDIKYFKQIFSPSKMIMYIRSELKSHE